MPRTAPPEPFKKAVGRRLLLFIDSLGITEAELCRQLADDIELVQNKVTHWEKGRNLPDVWVMKLLHDKYGLSLDWLYCDDRSHVSAKLLKMVERAGDASGSRPFGAGSSSPSRAKKVKTATK